MLKDQINVKSDLGEIKKGDKKKWKSKDQRSVIQNVQNFFDFKEKVIDLFRNYAFLLFEAKYKIKYGRGLKILTSK